VSSFQANSIEFLFDLFGGSASSLCGSGGDCDGLAVAIPCDGGEELVKPFVGRDPPPRFAYGHEPQAGSVRELEAARAPSMEACHVNEAPLAVATQPWQNLSKTAEDPHPRRLLVRRSM